MLTYADVCASCDRAASGGGRLAQLHRESRDIGSRFYGRHSLPRGVAEYLRRQPPLLRRCHDGCCLAPSYTPLTRLLHAYTPLTRLLHASYTPLTRLHASCTPLARLLHASCTPLTRLLHAFYTPLVCRAEWQSICASFTPLSRLFHASCMPIVCRAEWQSICASCLITFVGVTAVVAKAPPTVAPLPAAMLC
jgi:hypothetical protein